MKKEPKFVLKNQRPYKFKLAVRSEKQAEEVKAFFCKALSRFGGMSRPLVLELSFPRPRKKRTKHGFANVFPKAKRAAGGKK